MRATRYSVPFFISCFVHIVAFALSPGDFFHSAAAWEKDPPIRLRVIGPGSVKRAKGIEDGVSENLPFPKESRREIEKRESALLPRAVKKGASGEQMRKKVGDLQAKVPDRGPDLPLIEGHAGKIEEKQVKIPEDPDSSDEAKGENLFLAPVNLLPFRGVHGKGRAPIFSPPVIASIPEPQYPEVSRRHGEEGVVMLSVAIDERGRGGEIEVLSSSGYGRLDRAAISALKRARFVPAKEGGRAVSSVKKIAVRFSLKESE